jgi:arylsulfatase A-like enzyme
MPKRKLARSSVAQRKPPITSRARISFEGLVPVLVHLAVPWMIVAVLELGLSALISNTAMRNDQLPFGARISLAAYNLAGLVVCVCAIGGALMVLARLGRPGVRPVLRWMIGGLQTIVVWVVVFLYGTSWAVFWNTGVFLDREAFAFWAPNLVQVFHWVYPPLAIGVIVATLIVAVALSLWIPKWTASRRPSFQRKLVLTAGGAVGACAVVALLGGLAYGRVNTEIGQAISPYDVNRDDSSGPSAHALADLRRRLWRPAELSSVVARDKVQIIRRPIIPMEQYLARIDQSRIKRWNVLMVQVESLRSDQLRIYGGTRDVMPALDALARESRVFTNAYIQASHSNYADPVPLSSQYPLRSLQAYVYPKNPTYPRVLIYDVLKALGYQTAIISSQNENWGGMINYEQTSNLDHLFDAETFGGPTYAPFGDTGFAEWVKQTKSAGSVDDRYTVQDAIQWIDSLRGKPFFIHMNLQSSHVPYVVPADFPHRFSPKKLDFTIMWGRFPRDKVDVVKGVYADSLAYEDSQLQRLFQHLRDRGLWENTVIVVGGDNGEAFYEHGFASHASALYNEVMKVPMIIRAPGLTPGVDDRPAMFLDVPPSILHLLGLPPHPSFQGISLFEPRPDPDRSIFMVVQTPLAYGSGIVRSGVKLMFDEREGKYYLYDLRADPGEKTNIASSRPDLVKDLAGRLRAWREEQLSYYADVARQAREYPPFFAN